MRQIDFNDPAHHSLLKGKLRILRTEDPQHFNFVEVGEWVNHGHHSTPDQSEIFEFRDRLVYDENGNTVSRRIYEKHGEIFQIKEDWTSEIVNGRFLQHVRLYENGILAAEYTRNVLNYQEPKSDAKKSKVPFGTDTAYYSDGSVHYIKCYDAGGVLISEEIHSR